MSAAPANAFVYNHPSLDLAGGGRSATGEPAKPAPLVESADLLQGAKAVGILHNGSLYRLQATRLGKLILTK